MSSQIIIRWKNGWIDRLIIIDFTEKHMGGGGREGRNEMFRTNFTLFFILHDVYDIILIYVANDYYQIYIHIR